MGRLRAIVIGLILCCMGVLALLSTYAEAQAKPTRWVVREIVVGAAIPDGWEPFGTTTKGEHQGWCSCVIPYSRLLVRKRVQ
jgi:hypothetical protein